METKKAAEYAQEYINSKKDKLADEFGHLFGYCVYDVNSSFPVMTYFFDAQGRFFKTLGPDQPKKVMSSLYPTHTDFEAELKSEYVKLAESYGKKVIPTVESFIHQSPFKIAAYTLEGDEAIIKKLTFSEKLKGEKYLLLSKYIDKESLLFLIQNYKKSFNGVYYFPYLNKVHTVFEIPQELETTYKGVSMEITSLMKTKVFKAYDFIKDSYKIPDMGIRKPVLTVVKIPAERILEISFSDLYLKLVSNIKQTIEFISGL